MPPVKMTREEYKAKYGAEPQIKAAPTPSRPLAEVGSQLADDIQVRADRMREVNADPNRSKVQKIARAVGESAGTGSDIIGAGISLVDKALLGGGLSKGAQALADTELGRKALKAFQKGEKAYDEFAKKYPGVADFTTPLLQVGGLATEVTGAGLARKPVTAGIKTAVKGAKAVDEAIVGPVTRRLDSAVAEKQVEKALEITAPTLNKTQRIEALKQAGRKGGVASKGPLGTFKRGSTDFDVEVARAVGPFITRNPVTTLQNINTAVETIGAREIRPFLRANPSPFNEKQFNAYLKRIEKPDLITADPVLNKTYDLFRDRAMELVRKQKHTMEGLYDARLELDSIYRQQKGKFPDGERKTALTEAYLDTRRAMNDYIAHNTRGAGAKFKSDLRRQHLLLEGRERIAEANQKAVGTSAVRRFISAHPIASTVIGTSALAPIVNEVF